MSAVAKQWLNKIRALDAPGPVRIMNVCGGHERSVTSAGLRSLLPESVELIPGPGCPVCICPEQDIHQAIRLALEHDIILCAFGDMLRVPVNVSKSEPATLEQARAAGADIRPVASPLEVVTLAEQNPLRQVIFFAAGFETTMAPVAAMLAAGVPGNLLMLLSGRRTWPAVAMLLESGKAKFDGLIVPGHVATVMGPEEWLFVTEKHRTPAAIAGFTPESLLQAIHSVLQQISSTKPVLDNCYRKLVRPGGNTAARRILDSVMDTVDASWRGIGSIEASGFSLNDKYADHDARLVFPPESPRDRRRAGEMPAGCSCADVVLGQIYPNQCRLYGTACRPGRPAGPCMVSDEGACQIWWRNGIRENNAGARV